MARISRFVCSLVIAGLLASIGSLHAQAAETLADCVKIRNSTRDEAEKIDPADMMQCIRRGWGPPPALKKDGGKNAGINSSGAGGVYNGGILAPEASPGARNARASTTAAVIKSTCSFPPRIKMGLPPTISFPAGSCADFFKDLLKDKNGVGGAGMTPNAVGANDSCPAENDTSGMYGTKTPLTAGTMTQTCGGMVPVSGTDLVLTPNPTSMAVTEEGSYFIWLYKKTASGWQMDGPGPAKLPKYLCKMVQMGDGEVRMKSIDLTPPVAQMITYNKNSDHIQLKLQPRETMDVTFIPPYTQGDPELYLTLWTPSDSGEQTIEIPEDCAIDLHSERGSHGTAVLYAAGLAKGRDARPLTIHSSTNSGCEDLSATATMVDVPTVTCTPNPNGGPPSCPPAEHWFKKCVGDQDADASGTCPQDAMIPPEARCLSSPSGGSANANCDIVTMRPQTMSAQAATACTGKVQYGVLNRPALYFPPGTTSKFLPIQGRTAMMAETTSETQFFTQGQTTFYITNLNDAYFGQLGTITFNEGGTIMFKDGSQLLMQAPATFETAKFVTAANGTKGMTTGSITLTGGGTLVSAGGTAQQTFSPGMKYTGGPVDNNVTGIEVHVGRSVTLPAGMSIPTVPALCPFDAAMKSDGKCYNASNQVVPAVPPYVRQPIEPLPQ